MLSPPLFQEIIIIKQFYHMSQGNKTCQIRKGEITRFWRVGWINEAVTLFSDF